MKEHDTPLLEATRRTINIHPYPGYPAQRLSIENAETLDNLTLPDGEWSTQVTVMPSLEKQQELKDKGYELDNFGRPLHPWLREMLADPDVGVVTGMGEYWEWGPNYAGDPIVINTDEDPKVLLIKRGDTGAWALPGGFGNGAEAARRELFEETGLLITGEPAHIYSGIVADSRTTAHAWCETTAVLWRINGTPNVKGLDDAVDAAWVPVSELSDVYGSHKIFIEQAMQRLDEIQPTHAISLPFEAESFSDVCGGHMSYHRFIAKTADGDRFIKSHDKHAFTDADREIHSREYLEKEKLMYDHINTHGLNITPENVELLDGYHLVMEAYAPEDGWHWRAPADNIDAYVRDVFAAIDKLATIPLPDDFHDTDAPSNEQLYWLGWHRYDFVNSYFRIQQHFETLYPKFRGHFREAAETLAQSTDILHMFATPIDEGETFTHHDMRQANIAWHPEHGARIVDWSWAGAGPKNADATMLLIDLHKSGYDVSKYMDRFNPKHAKALIGFWLAQCQLPSRSSDSNVRFQQALSAVSADDLLLRSGTIAKQL